LLPRLQECHINVYEPRVEEILQARDAEGAIEGAGVRLADGSEHALTVLYGGLGCKPNLEPARSLGLKLDCDGYVIADANAETSVSGIYAAGDISSDLNQISVAFGEAATAAVRIHNRLADDEGLTS
jgi:thioredoxin reductase (NADPH)